MNLLKTILKKTLTLTKRLINNRQENKKLDNLYKIYEKYSDYTMIPKYTFVENLKLCKRFHNIEGCIVECGVWRGGMSAAISEVMGLRQYYLFDSFEGLPEAKEIDGEAAIKWQSDKEGPLYHDNCKAEIDYATQAMADSGAKNYQLIKGWFSDTLPEFSLNNEKIAILRLDGDWYESTMECLTFLYPKVSKGGIIILDDYYSWDGCSKAVHDYLSTHKLADKIYQIDQYNCYLIKT